MALNASRSSARAAGCSSSGRITLSGFSASTNLLGLVLKPDLVNNLKSLAQGLRGLFVDGAKPLRRHEPVEG